MSLKYEPASELQTLGARDSVAGLEGVGRPLEPRPGESVSRKQKGVSMQQDSVPRKQECVSRNRSSVSRKLACVSRECV